MRDVIYLGAFAILIFLYVVAFPLLLLWAVNTLVPSLSIGYTLLNWFASLVLVTILNTTPTFQKGGN